MKEFAGRTLLIATMHGKEMVIGPVLQAKLDVGRVITRAINTDQFGTFTGEKARTDSPIEAARKKCDLAFQQTGETLVLASEGSFGPHPEVGFLPINEEWLIFQDRESKLEILERRIFYRTNFAQQMVNTLDELISFAKKCSFPSHALILKNPKTNELYKAIQDQSKLLEIATHILSDNEALMVETDMRAHLNPTRMTHIQEVAVQLANRISKRCPSCYAPGFGVTDVERGLPCGLCGNPTRSVMYQIYTCPSCCHTEKKLRPDKKTEDPMFCDLCNP